MKVGSDTADTLKKQSELQQIPFANLLSDDGASDRRSIWRKECATDSLAMGHSAKKRGL